MVRTGSRGVGARDATVAVVGAVVIAAALGGLLVIEARGGPFVYELVPAELPVVAEGSYRTTGPVGSTGPGGACVPPVPEPACAPAETSVRLHLQGPPELGGASYAVFLTATARTPLLLGLMERAEDAWRFEHQAEEDRRGYERLVVAAEAVASPRAPEGVVVFDHPIGAEARGPDGRVDLGSTAPMPIGSGSGEVRLDQIGAVTVSATVEVFLQGVEERLGWELRAWLLDGEGQAAFFGTLASQGGGVAVVDERLERVHLPEQERFVLTWEAASAPPGEAPDGIVAYEADLDFEEST